MTWSWQLARHHAIRWPNTKSLFLFAGLNVALERTRDEEGTLSENQSNAFAPSECALTQ